MVRPFLLFVGVMLLVTGGVLLHYITHDGSKQQTSLEAFVAVTGFSSPSFSVAYYEARLYLQDERMNPAYPQMQPINRMDLVYGK